MDVVVLSAGSAAELLVGGTRLTVADGPQVVPVDGGRLLWLPAADGVPDQDVASWGAAGPCRLAVLGARTATGAAHALARLRAAGAVDGGTTCALVGLGPDRPAAPELALRARHWGVSVPTDGERLGATEPPTGTAPPTRLPGRTLVLGGIRSGKSALAEDLLAAEPAVTYLAAGAAPSAAEPGDGPGLGDGPADGEWARRVAAHRARRPGWWRTVEGPDLAAAADGDRPVLLDSVGSWLTGTLDAVGAWSDEPGWQDRLAAAQDRLLRDWRAAPGPVVAVAEEVGWGLVPATAAGRLFTDELGRLNQRLAAVAEQVLLCVAGRTVVVASPAAAGAASSAGTDPRAGAR